MNDSHATRIDRAEGRGRSFGREDNRNPRRNPFQSSAKSLIAGGTEDIAAACVCIHDRTRFNRRQQLDHGVNTRRFGKESSIHPRLPAHTGCMEGEALWRHSLSLGFGDRIERWSEDPDSGDRAHAIGPPVLQ
jgi:hypothetical protein